MERLTDENSVAGGRYVMELDFIHESFRGVRAIPGNPVWRNHYVADHPRVPLTVGRGTEEGDGRALAGGCEVHGSGIHAYKECCAMQQSSELCPGQFSCCGDAPWAELGCERLCAFYLLWVRSCADANLVQVLQEVLADCGPTFQGPTFPPPPRAGVEDGVSAVCGC